MGESVLSFNGSIRLLTGNSTVSRIIFFVCAILASFSFFVPVPETLGQEKKPETRKVTAEELKTIRKALPRMTDEMKEKMNAALKAKAAATKAAAIKSAKADEKKGTKKLSATKTADKKATEKKVKTKVDVKKKPVAPAPFAAPALAVARPAVKKDDKSKNAKFKNPLGLIASPMAKLVKFNTEGGVLKPEFSDAVKSGSYNDIYTAMNEMRQAVGGYGGGGSYGSGSWQQSISGQKLNGQLSFGRTNNNFGSSQESVNKRKLIVDLKEVIDKQRKLYMSTNLDGEINISLNGGQSAFLLRFRQEKSGNVVVQSVSDENVFSGFAENFEQFCVNYPDFVQKQLFPSLGEFGILEPLTRYSKATQDTVIKILSLKDDPRFQKFRDTITELDAAEYKVREAATKRLKDSYKEWSDLMQVAVGDNSFSFESRSRIKSILKEKTSKDDHRVLTMVIKSKLAEKPDYLVWLLSRTPEAKRSRVVMQLEKLTDERFGEDISAWNKWANVNKTEVNIPESLKVKPDLTKESGVMNDSVGFVNQLVNIHLKDKKLTIDESKWAIPFGNESIQESVKEIEALMKKKGLPKSWLKLGNGYNVATVKYEQVIFENLVDAIKPKVNSSNYYYYNNYNNYRSTNSSPNRMYDGANVTTRLERNVHNRNGVVNRSKDKTREMFRYELTEKSGSRRSIVVEKSADNFRISYSSEQANSIVQLIQDKDGAVVVQDIRGIHVFSTKAKSFDELFKKNEKYLKEQLYPVFAIAGAQFDKGIGGNPKEITPIDAKNTVLRTKKVKKN